MASHDSRLPFTVLIPDSRRSPIEIYDHSVSLRMVVVERDAVSLLDNGWDAPGAYVLLDSLADDGTFGVYVGKAPAGLRKRLVQHVRLKEWSRALLIQRGDYNGLSSAQAGWLEGDLYELFEASARGRLNNAQRPGDDTVPSYDLRILESFRDPITRVLRLLGYDTSTPSEEPVVPIQLVYGDADSISLDDDQPWVAQVSDEQSPAKKQRRKTYYPVKFKELVDSGLILPGDRLVSTNSTWPATATVTEDGLILVNGREFSAPSSAGMAVTGNKAVDGWNFWAVDKPGRTTCFELRRQYLLIKAEMDKSENDGIDQ